MKAAVAENRARVVMAEAEVPRAMAEAFRQGGFELANRNGRVNCRPHTPCAERRHTECAYYNHAPIVN